jgi:hypothetical protein
MEETHSLKTIPKYARQPFNGITLPILNLWGCSQSGGIYFDAKTDEVPILAWTIS